MQEISEKKKKFLESIGIDIDNLPPEFEKHSSDMERTVSSDEMAFFDRESLTGRYKKQFCLRDLVGTSHPDYSDKSWLEAFLLSKRGDSAVEQYFKNPEYYSIDLKEFDQSNLRHDSPIELYENDGQFFIRGGNNRLSLIMMKYLAEMSKAQTEEERAKIDEEYTFVAEVNPLPKDKDIMYMINMIRGSADGEVYIKKTATREEECQYTIQIGDKTVQIQSKEDLEQFIRDSYNIDKAKSIQELGYNLGNLVRDEIMYGANEDKKRILDSLFPNLQQFKDTLVKLRTLGLEEQLYDGIDLNNIDFSEISNKATLLVKKEENRRQAEEQRKAQEKEQQEKADREAKEKAKQESKEKSAKRKQETVVALKRDHIESQTQDIPNGIETTYYELKQEEIKFSGLARKLGLTYSITRTDDTNIYSSIEQIKNNMQRISEQIQKVDDPTKLDKVSGVLQELNSLTQDGTIKTEYSAELKQTFEKSFDNKVQDLIKSSKLSRLEQEKGQVESEKVSLIGKLLGKGRLKQAKLDNIDLKMQLLMSETQSDKMSYSLEDSLSDLYTYSQCELGRGLTPEMKEFLSVIKTDSQLRQMIDQQQLKQQFNEKVKNRPNEVQLMPLDENRRISNRHQADILQVQNIDMNRQIQNNRARTVTLQNNLSSMVIDSNNPLNRFQSIVNEVKLSTQTRETREPQRTQQEGEMQL